MLVWALVILYPTAHEFLQHESEFYKCRIYRCDCKCYKMHD